MIIRPTDKEIGEDICIAAAGYGLESIARDETATIAEPASVDSLLRGSRDSRQIEDNTGWLGICFQDLGHQRAAAATNIDHHGELPKIVGFDGGAMPEWRFARHRPIEQQADLRLLDEVLVRRHPQGELTPALSGSHGLGQLSPHPVEELAMRDPQIFSMENDLRSFMVESD